MTTINISDLCDRTITVQGNTTTLQVSSKKTRLGHRSLVTVIYGQEKDQRYVVKGDVNWAHDTDAVAEAIQKRKDIAEVNGAVLE